MSKQVCYLGEEGKGEGGTKGVNGGMQVGFEVLGVVYGWWGAGRAGQIMLSEAKWLSVSALTHSPSFFDGTRCALSDAKGQDVALADAQAGMRAGLQRGTQPSGTHHGTAGLRE